MSPKKTADQTAATDIFETDDQDAQDQRERDAAEELAAVADVPGAGEPTDDQPAATDAREDRATADQLADANDPLSQLAAFHAADEQRAASRVDFEAAAEKARAMRAAGTYHNAPVTDAEAAASEAAGGDSDGFFIDMTTAEERIAPMAIGTRAVVSCTAAEAKLSASGGNPMIAIRVKLERVISVPDVTIDTSAYRNRSTRDNLLFTGPNPVTGSKGQLWRCKLAFDAFGVEWDRGIYKTKSAFLAMLTRKAEELVGCVCEVEYGIDANDGSNGKIQYDQHGDPYPPKNTIARFYPYTPQAAKIADDDLPF